MPLIDWFTGNADDGKCVANFDQNKARLKEYLRTLTKTEQALFLAAVVERLEKESKRPYCFLLLELGVLGFNWLQRELTEEEKHGTTPAT